MPSIIANFASTNEAERAMRELKALGVDAVSIHPIHPGEDVHKDSPPMMWGRYGYSPKWSAVDPYTSPNMSGDGRVFSKNVVLTAVASDDLIDRAVGIIKRFGGDV